jgi:hypothetical protein
MRKLRNPRYAPEFLERKLSPSDMNTVIPVTVVMAPPTDLTANTPPVVSMDQGPGTSIDFPPPPPPPPAGPTGPAVAQ